MRSFLSLLFKLLCATSLYAQPSNDNPCGAIPLEIGSNCVFQTFATNGATRSPNIPNPSCGDYTGSNDVWFVVQVPASGTMIINTNQGTLRDMSMAAYYADNCSGTFTQVACATGGGNSPNMPYLEMRNLTPGRYLFIRVWDRVCTNLFNCGLPTDGYQQGTFQICAQAGYNVYTGGSVNTGSYTCGSTPPAGNTCETATPICTFQGYCGSTSGYTANYWYNGSRGLGGVLNAQGIFCGSIENNSFIKFIAGSTSVNLDVIVSGSSSACDEGVQFMMFGNPTGAASCQSLDIVSYGCESPMPPGTNNFVATGLTPGREYYLMVDGYAGDRCTYQINAISGILVRMSAGLDRTICLGETVTMSIVGNGPGTITWTGPGLNNNNAATVTATPTATGTFQYIVEAPTLNPACAGRPTEFDTVLVTVIGPPNDFTLTQSGGCAGDTVTLSASGAFTYVWTPTTGLNATSGPTIKASTATPTTYTVTASNTAGCFLKKQISVSPSGGPVLTVSASKDTICSGGSGAVLTASPGFSSYTWTPGTGLSSTSGQTVTANPATAGNYTYTVTGTLAGCPNSTAQTSVRVISGATVSVTPASSNICSGQSVTLTAAPVGNYNWTGTGGFSQNNTSSVTVSPTANATYTATSTVCPNSGSATVNVTAAPASLTAVNGSRCGTGIVPLSVTGSCSGTIRWFDAATGGNQLGTGATFTTPSISANTTYYASCTVNTCEGPRVAVTASLTNNPPNISVTPTAELSCTTGQAQLTGNSSTAGATFSWSGPGIVSGAATAIPIVNASGTYTFTVTNPANGCTATADVTVTPNTNQPNANAGSDQTLTCVNTSLTLNGSSSTGGVTFSWTGPGITSGGNTATPTVNQSGNYTLTVTNTSNGCSSADQVQVNQNTTLPDVSITPPGSLDCTNPSLILSANSLTSGVNFSWTGPGITSGGNTSSPAINAPGNYIVTVTNPANGCVNTASVNVNGGANLPNVSIAPPTELTCSVNTVTINGNSTTSGVSYSWSGPGIVSGGSTDDVVVNAPGTYTLTVTETSTNCTNSASVDVSQDIVAAVVSIQTPGELNCTNAQVALTATADIPNVGYAWSGPGIVGNNNTASVQVNAPGNYSVQVTNLDNGCVTTVNQSVTQNTTLPNVSITPPGTLSCSQTSIVIQGNSSTSGVSFSWSGPGIVSGGASNATTVNQPGVYTLTVNNPSNGCENTANVTVLESADVPVVNISVSGELTCSVSEVILTATSSVSGVSFSWSGPGIVGGGNQAVVTVNQTGNYTVTVLNPLDGCTGSGSASVNSNTATPDANAGADVSLTCTQLTVALNGSSATNGASFSWSGPGIVSGGSTATPTVNATGSYTLTVTDPVNGCVSTDMVEVNQDNAPPSVNIAPPATLDCGISQVTLSASSPTLGATFSWSGPGIVSGGNSATPVVNTAGIYVVTATNPANGCTATAQVEVLGTPGTPDLTLGSNPSINCTSATTLITAQSSTPNATFAWSGPGVQSGGSTNTATVNQPGTYTVTVTNPANNCTATGQVIVSLDTLKPTVSLSPASVLTCSNPTTAITASSNPGSGINYAWSGPGILGASDQSTVQVNQSGLYQVTVTNSVNGCSSSASASVVNDTIQPYESITSAVDCSSGTGNVDVNVNATNVTYNWTGPSIVGSTTVPQILVDQSGRYTVTVTNLDNGCASTVFIDIVLPLPFTIDAEIKDNPCPQVQEGVIDLSIIGGVSPFTFLWSDGSQNEDLVNVFGGDYQVTIRDASGCSQSASYFVPQGIFNVTAFQDASIELGESVSLSGQIEGGSAQVVVVWSPSEYLNCTDCLEPVAIPFEDIMYVLTAVDTNGCADSDTIYIDVNTEYDLYFPNAITPNGDRRNDAFKALGNVDLVNDYVLQVFNRWGELVFETNDIRKGWDGTHKGEMVSSDGFIHHAKATFINGDVRTYRGIVLVLR